MLPSMPIISLLQRSPRPEMNHLENEEVNNVSTISILSGEQTSNGVVKMLHGDSPQPQASTSAIDVFSAASNTPISQTSQILQLSPRRSPCSDLMSIKKASPLKHVTPILRKYSAHRNKAKISKKLHPYLAVPRVRKAQPCVMIKDTVDPPSPPELDELEEEEHEEQHTPPSPVAEEPGAQETEALIEDDVVENNEADFDPPSSPLKDNEEDLAALMRASTTITTCQRPPPIKRSRHAKEIEATLACLKPEDPTAKEDRENHLATAFFNKVREELLADGEEEKFLEFADALTSSEETGVVKMNSRVQAVLEGHPNLFAEFLAFFSRQPHVIRMVIGNLAALAEQPKVTEEDVKAIMLPLLRTSPLLTDLLLAMLPASQTPDSMMVDFEDLLCEEGEVADDEDPVEMLHIPVDDFKDPYGGDACICTCHTDTEDERYKSRTEHCIPCGLKFIHGKIYVQAGKTLRPAKVSFLNEDIHEAINRLTAFSTSGRTSVTRYRKRTGNSFSNDPSGIKDSPPKLALDESDNEDSENYRNFSEFSSPKSSRCKAKSKSKDAIIQNGTADFSKELMVHLSPETKNHHEPLLSPTGSSSCDLPPCDSEVLSPPEPDSAAPGDEDIVEEEEDDLDLDEEVEEEEEDFEDIDEIVDESSQEVQCCEPIQVHQNGVAIPEVKEEPEIKLESVIKVEEEMIEEPSRDSPPPSSSEHQNIPTCSTVSPDKDPCWTRDEDKAILQAFQQGGTAQRMLLTVRQLLPERTAEQIMGRFQILLKLLQQMSSAARESTTSRK
ncbi:hypothetical protein B566_EDAN014479 [Ephemera danica]|nr:hypothetical protein B566_EDAN014479 [Ephemera danica]